MKKVLSCAILLILLCGLLTVSVYAAGSGSLEMTSATGSAGEEVTLNVKLNSNPGLVTMTIRVKYDTSALQLTKVTEPGLLKGTQLNHTYGSPYTISWVDGSATTNNSATGTIATFTFKILESAPIGKNTVTLEFVDSYDADYGENSFTATSGTVTVACKNHSYGSWTKLNDTQHQRVCTKCNAPEVRSHNWSEAKKDPPATCTQPGTIKYTCQTCNATKTETVDPTGHAWDNACDSECNNGCGETREASHTFGTTFVSDETGHWYECSVCKEKKDFALHTPGPEATNENPQICTVCEYIIAPAIHQHDMSTEWMRDSEYHWYRCNTKGCYYVEQWEKHVYDNACDVSCNTCGHIRVDAPHNYLPELQGNAQGHWRICADCFAQSEIAAHIPGPEATETEAQRCEECNIVLKMPLSHECTFGEMWYSDGENHWKCCADAQCPEISDKSVHVWNEGVEQPDGSMLYTCTVCNKEVNQSELIPSQPTTPPTTPVPSNPGQTDDPQEPETFPWIWVGLAAAVLMIAGIVLLIIEFVRSRKTNSHGKFSK